MVVPAYNAEQFVVATLESVRNQRFTNWELILVDDGSSDGTRQVVADYLESHPGKMRVLAHPHGENRGTSATRNLGLQQATGELICFLDADDVWKPEFLELFVAEFARFPELAMAYGPCIYWYPGREGRPEKVQETGLTGGIHSSAVLLRQFLEDENTVPSPSGVMLRRSRILEAGGWEEDFRGMFDDQALYSKLLLASCEVFLTDRPLYYYRQHAASLCGTALRENSLYENRKGYLAWLTDYLERAGVTDPAFRKTVEEQTTLLEIRNQIDREFAAPASKWQASLATLRQVAALKKAEQTRFSAKVLRYGLSYLAARLLATGEKH